MTHFWGRKSWQELSLFSFRCPVTNLGNCIKSRKLRSKRGWVIAFQNTVCCLDKFEPPPLWPACASAGRHTSPLLFPLLMSSSCLFVPCHSSNARVGVHTYSPQNWQKERETERHRWQHRPVSLSLSFFFCHHRGLQCHYNRRMCVCVCVCGMCSSEGCSVSVCDSSFVFRGIGCVGWMVAADVCACAWHVCKRMTECSYLCVCVCAADVWWLLKPLCESY